LPSAFEEWTTWSDSSLFNNAFDHAPNESEVCEALFATDPVEWNQLPQFQDVTIRLIAEKGVLQGHGGELYIHGEAATGKITISPPSFGRIYHLFCSPFNAGAAELAEELRASNVVTKKSAALACTTDIGQLTACEHMLVLLDERTWTSGEDTAQLVEHIHCSMRAGVHIICAHEFPSVVGPPRHECDFDKMFDDDRTPAHLTRRPSNLYNEPAVTLKGVEWRKPGLVSLADRLAASVGEHDPIEFEVPEAYQPTTEPNPWKDEHGYGAAQVARARMSRGASELMLAPPPPPAAPPSRPDGVELTSMPMAMPVPSPRARRRSADADAREEMRLSCSSGSREPPPSHRASGRAKEIRPQTNTFSQDADDSLRASVVGRARADSLAEEPSVCWAVMRSSSGHLGSSMSALGDFAPGAAPADRPLDRVDHSRASVVGRARADSLAEDPSACWVAVSRASKPGAAQAGRTDRSSADPDGGETALRLTA